MKRIVVFGFVGVLLLSATGCGSPDALMKELIANLNLLADVIEKKEPRDKLQGAIERVNATADKINKLKLSDEQKAELFKKHEAELNKVKSRLEEAQKKRALEGGADDIPPIVVDNYLKK
jgi:hypothetical protein